MSYRRTRAAAAGASLLLEVVFGIAIFSVSLLLLFGIFPTAQRSVNQARDVGIANNLAREFLERERALPYGDVGNITQAATAPPELVTVPTVVNGVNGQTTFEVTVAVAEPEPGKRKVITVVVAWHEGSGPLEVDREVGLECFKVQYPGLVGP